MVTVEGGGSVGAILSPWKAPERLIPRVFPPAIRCRASEGPGMDHLNVGGSAESTKAPFEARQLPDNPPIISPAVWSQKRGINRAGV